MKTEFQQVKRSSFIEVPESRKISSTFASTPAWGNIEGTKVHTKMVTVAGCPIINPFPLFLTFSLDVVYHAYFNKTDMGNI